MYRTVLVATDGSALAAKALKAAVRMAAGSRAKLYVLNVQPTFAATLAPVPEAPFVVDAAGYERAVQDAAARILTRACRLARRRGVRCVPVYESADDVARRIVRVAKRVRADVIAMGSHGRGRVAALLLGGTTQKVLASCRIPVLVHR